MNSNHFTADLAETVVSIRHADLTEATRERTRHAVLDWIGVAIGGSDEPSARIIQAVVVAEGSIPVASIIGSPLRVSASQAALANGVAAHALDFDDCSAWSMAHPSTPVLSGAFALAEELGADGPSVMEAVAAGYQAMAVIGTASGTGSYAKGFHSTGTLGTFGAASACARLFGLDQPATQWALGLAATQAAGLRASFGTMGKHLNAAKAASNGLLAARLASAGFTGPPDAIESSAGFEAAFNREFGDFDPSVPAERMGEQMAVEELTYKFHACCAGTQPAIEGIIRLRERHPFCPDDVERVQLEIPEQLFGVCSIADPTTGVEGKFSLSYATALAMSGRATGPASFTDDSVRDPELVALTRRVDLIPKTGPGDPKAIAITVTLKDGTVLEQVGFAPVPADDEGLGDQWRALVTKFRGLVTPVLGPERSEAIIRSVRQLDALDDISDLLALTAASGSVRPFTMAGS